MQIEQAIKEISDKETSIQNEYKTLQKEEFDLTDKILKKYGEGELNLNEGVFIPQKAS